MMTDNEIRAQRAVQSGMEDILDGNLKSLPFSLREAELCDADTLWRMFETMSYTGTHGPDADRARDAFRLHCEVYFRRHADADDDDSEDLSYGIRGMFDVRKRIT